MQQGDDSVYGPSVLLGIATAARGFECMSRADIVQYHRAAAMVARADTAAAAIEPSLRQQEDR